ncbi:MAG: hypothetical protein K6A35_01645 [bacterium]|nr:hypothetical protein [bacterium]
MKRTFQDVVSCFKSCSHAELERISETIFSIISMDMSDTNELMEKELRISCPACGSGHWVRNGHSKTGIQHYICRDCGKAFSKVLNVV